MTDMCSFALFAKSILAVGFLGTNHPILSLRTEDIFHAGQVQRISAFMRLPHATMNMQ